MKTFMDDNFLLTTAASQKLFHNYAESMPIVDYHCHINPKEIAEDRKFENITQVWLGGDHYKWRQMRSNGIEECYITGNAPDREKFQKWAETLEKAIGNPLFHWSHLELQRYFDYHGVLNKKTAQEVWELCNRKLQEDGMSVRNMILRLGVKLLCTTDDPADDLQYHKAIAADSDFQVQVLPAWRPDKAMNIEKKEYREYLEQLGACCGIKIHTWTELKEALRKRMEYFREQGCRVSDHALTYVMYYPVSETEMEGIFSKRVSGGRISREEELKFKTGFMRFTAGEYTKMGWVMQLHFGCRRDNNTAMFSKLGPDTGYDGIYNYGPADQLAEFLDSLEREGNLPKIILYSLNPNDDEMIGSMIGCYQQAKIPGKIQQGSAWWFNDHKTGMMKQMTSLANQGLLGNFIGMLTDSRSFLSYPRHEYFRRILCKMIGDWVEQGEYPDDWELLGRIVKDISYNNAVRYFRFDLPVIP